MGKLLILIGCLCIIFGILVTLKIPIPFGKLPGDISIKGENAQFYFPIVSCILLSIFLSILFYFISDKN